MILGYRSSDAVITICQTNSTKSIEIRELNKAAEELTGYASGQLKSKPLTHILPPRIADLLKEYVEFEGDANDVGQVLTKVQSFSIVGKDGKENGYRLKVVRSESDGRTIVFQLVLQSKTGLRKNEALRKAIQESFKGHEVLDADFGLPDRNSLAKDIALMSHYNNQSQLRSCFAIVQADHFDDLFSQYGRDTCRALVKHIAFICRQNLRPDDLVGITSHKRIGVLLIDTTPDSSRMVFNRLRWQIAANPFKLPDQTTIGLSVSMSFCRIGGHLGDKTLLEDCDKALADDAVNALLEIEEANRRQS